jgi:hypothetical protein
MRPDLTISSSSRVAPDLELVREMITELLAPPLHYLLPPRVRLAMFFLDS